MRQLHIGILDLVTKSPTRSLYARVMHANLASIMPQVLGVWCERAGHRVSYVCYTGLENLLDEVPPDVDLLFIGAFTQAAQLAYGLSNLFRKRGAVTVLGGPHARCYPEDAARYFDYVLGFTDQTTVDEVLRECTPHRPLGRCLSASRQPTEFPPLAERWKFVQAALRKAPTIKIVPMIGSLGCPYTCSFCIDSTVDYQPLGFPQLQEDLRFLLSRVKRPIVGWHDPNFGIKFDQYMDAIEAAVPPGRMRHIAETSLSILSEPHLARLQRNGFRAILPGIESWFDLGNKSKTRLTGVAKVRQVAQQRHGADGNRIGGDERNQEGIKIMRITLLHKKMENRHRPDEKRQDDDPQKEQPSDFFAQICAFVTQNTYLYRLTNNGCYATEESSD